MNQVQYCNSFGGMPKHCCLAFLIFFSRKNLRALFQKMWHSFNKQLELVGCHPVTSQRPILDELFYKVEQTSTVFNAKRYNRSFLRLFHSSRLSMLKTRSCHRKRRFLKTMMWLLGESWGGKIGPPLYTRSMMNLGVSATSDRCSVDKECIWERARLFELYLA